MKFFGLEIPGLTRDEVLARLDNSRVVFTPNPEILLEAYYDKRYLRVLKKADLLLPDGNGLQLVSTLKRFPTRILRALMLLPAMFTFLFFKFPFRTVYPEIIHGSDFMRTVVDWAELRGYSVFFLGAEPGVALQTARHFAARNPKLKIAGHSYVNPGKSAAKAIRDSKAQVVFVAYGAPKQEKWIVKTLPQLPSVKLIMGVGGSFDFITGKVKRAPRFMRKLGLEWLWRLLWEPRSRAKRIFNAVIKFPVVSTFYDVS